MVAPLALEEVCQDITLTNVRGSLVPKVPDTNYLLAHVFDKLYAFPGTRWLFNLTGRRKFDSFFEAVQKGDKKSAHYYNAGEIHDYDPHREAQFYLRRKTKYLGGEEAREFLTPIFNQLLKGVNK